MQTSISELPIGSLNIDYHTNCKDCLRPNGLSDFAFRQAYLIVRRDLPLHEEIYINKEGMKRTRMVYPVESLDYCYYHAKKRGLLAYQHDKEWDAYWEA